MRKPGPQKFSEDFRREAVRLVRESDKSVKALGAELGVSETTLRHWLRTIPAAVLRRLGVWLKSCGLMLRM